MSSSDGGEGRGRGGGGGDSRGARPSPPPPAAAGDGATNPTHDRGGGGPPPPGGGPGEQPPGCTSLLVRNLPLSARPDDLRGLLADKGVTDSPTDIYLPRFQDTGKLRGYGFIKYEGNAEGAVVAWRALQAAELDGRALTVEWATGQRKKPGDFPAGRGGRGGYGGRDDRGWRRDRSPPRHRHRSRSRSRSRDRYGGRRRSRSRSYSPRRDARARRNSRSPDDRARRRPRSPPRGSPPRRHEDRPRGRSRSLSR